MKRVPALSLVLAAFLAVGVTSGLKAQTTETAKRPPNIIFMLADDLGYPDLGCYGSTFYETPSLDALAASGLKFTQAYAACPVCSPSRAAIMTGKFPVRTGVTDFIHDQSSEKAQNKGKNRKLKTAPFQEYLSLDEVTIAEALKEGGYTTFIAGKWHLGNNDYRPEKQGFDVNFGANKSGHPKSYSSPYENPDLKDGPKGESLTDRLANEAVNFMKKNRDKTFFVYMPFYAVHIPLQPQPELLKKYQEKRRRLGLTDEITTDGKLEVRRNQSNPEYAAMVEEMDMAAGKLTKALKELGLAENTIVIFTSDNGGLSTKQGWPTSNEPLRCGKGLMYEGGIRVPLIVNWPGKIAAGVTSATIAGTDFYPTLLEVAGLPLRPAQHVDAKSFLPILKGNPAEERGAIYWHYPHYGDQGGQPSSAVREGDWKLIRWYEDNRTELFNIKDDLSEKHDLADSNPEKVKELSAKLDAWLKETGAKFATPN